jgi:hypothetical protein
VYCQSTSTFLTNCTLAGNSAKPPNGYGGGVWGGTLYNCTLTGNSSMEGGGVGSCTLYNCIVYYNSATFNPNYTADCTLDYCCTMPLPNKCVGNISSDPLLVDSKGNLNLQTRSPCINAGNNNFVVTDTDIEGNPRIVSGTVDIGAYEYQGTGSVISYAWLQQYGLPTDGSADFIDPDHDGMNDWQEWVCGTSPTNARSALRLLSATPSHTNANVTLTWQSVIGVNYLLSRFTNLSTPFTLLATNILGQAVTTSYADTNAIGAGPFFYHVGVQAP